MPAAPQMSFAPCYKKAIRFPHTLTIKPRSWLLTGGMLLLPLFFGAPVLAGNWPLSEVFEPEDDGFGEPDPKQTSMARKELEELEIRVRKGKLPKILFDFDSDKIEPGSRPTLDEIAAILRRHPDVKVMVLAHTCNMGSEEYNQDLSERRAKSVKAYLVKRGVPPPSIRFRGKGFSEPIADNATEEGRIRNRRVEFRLGRRGWSAVY